ncbi:MAG: hypothetical protein ACN4GR_03505 [Arenicellales bacterium]
MSAIDLLDQINDESETLNKGSFGDNFDADSELDNRTSAIQNLMKTRPAWRRIEEFFEMQELRIQINDPGFHF